MFLNRVNPCYTPPSHRNGRRHPGLSESFLSSPHGFFYLYSQNSQTRCLSVESGDRRCRSRHHDAGQTLQPSSPPLLPHGCVVLAIITSPSTPSSAAPHGLLTSPASPHSTSHALGNTTLTFYNTLPLPSTPRHRSPRLGYPHPVTPRASSVVPATTTSHRPPSPSPRTTPTPTITLLPPRRPAQSRPPKADASMAAITAVFF